MKQAVTLGDALKAAAASLQAAGLEEPMREARALMTAILGDRGLLLERLRPLTPSEQSRFEGFVQRRAAHEPLGRLTGQREFWSLPIGLSPDTLEPRPDSERLVEALLGKLTDRERPWRLLDLGTGSGCLLLALLHDLPRATGLGVDCAPGAIEQAQRNAQRLALDDRAAFHRGNWGAGLPGPYDVVLSNPPYIATSALAELSPEVRLFDPAAALDGGPDGLAAYRALLPDARRLLRAGGWLALEIGFDQGESVLALVQAAGFVAPILLQDLAGQPRVILAQA